MTQKLLLAPARWALRSKANFLIVNTLAFAIGMGGFAIWYFWSPDTLRSVHTKQLILLIAIDLFYGLVFAHAAWLLWGKKHQLNGDSRN